MDFPITKGMLNNASVLIKNMETKEYNDAVKEYVNKIIDLITKEIIFRLNPHPNGDKKYAYNFARKNIPNHPTLPYIIAKTKTQLYTNDFINILPINEIIEALKRKFPECKITLNEFKGEIIIDWS